MEKISKYHPEIVTNILISIVPDFAHVWMNQIRNYRYRTRVLAFSQQSIISGTVLPFGGPVTVYLRKQGL